MITDIINKKLELLKRLKEAQIVNYSTCWDDDDYDAETVYTLEDLISLEDISTIEKTLTPPTADEVCEALSEYWGSEAYIKDNNFWVKPNNEDYLAHEEYGIDINDNQITNYHYSEDEELWLMCMEAVLPPHLITLIGRFYEGESK